MLGAQRRIRRSRHTGLLGSRLLITEWLTPKLKERKRSARHAAPPVVLAALAVLLVHACARQPRTSSRMRSAGSHALHNWTA